MGRLTLRLPGTLHQQLRARAEQEGVSLNQHVVYALTRQVTRAYTVSAAPAEAVREQREQYEALLVKLGTATFSEIEQALADREGGEDVQGLRPEVLERLRARIAEARETASE